MDLLTTIKVLKNELQLCTLHFKLLTRKGLQSGFLKLTKKTLVSYLVASTPIKSESTAIVGSGLTFFARKRQGFRAKREALIYLFLQELTNKLRGNKHQQKANQNKHKKDTSFDIDINNLFISSFFFFANHNFDYTTVLNQYATENATIPNDKLINLGNNFDFGFFKIKGTIITAPNQPADKLINKSENVIQNFGSIFKSISYKDYQAGFIKLTKKALVSYLITSTPIKSESTAIVGSGRRII